MSGITIKVNVGSTTFEITTPDESSARKLIDDLTAKYFAGDGYNDPEYLLSK